MNTRTARQQLLDEGFDRVFVAQDAPGIEYPPHKHPFIAAHIVLKGAMTLTVKGKKTVLKAGDRLDVPANTVHVAQIGPAGCTFVIGQKD